MVLDDSALRPVIAPGPEGRPFWEGLQRGVVTLPRCTACDRLFFYPRPLCPECGSRELSWEEVSGRGRLEAFCVHYHSALPGLAEAVPFATALVRLAEGPRLMGFLLGVPEDPEQIRCGIELQARFVAGADGATALGFEPVPPHP
jgi:uncharacterized OB-fold protein